MSFTHAAPIVQTSRPRGRLLDIFVSSALLLLTAPLMLVVGLAIYTAMGSPVFFVQQRAGRGMREFCVRKFRTMRHLCGPDGALLPDAERQTSFTRLVRRSRLDELPQLVSVLTGDMGLVGPRPLLLSTIKEFGELGRIRCLVAPGLTGWAQVNGNTLLTDREKLMLDLWYIANRSPSLDALILLLTVRTIIFGEHKNHARLKAAEQHLGEVEKTAKPFTRGDF